MSSIHPARDRDGKADSMAAKASEVSADKVSPVSLQSKEPTSTSSSPGSQAHSTLSWDYAFANPLILASGIAATGALLVGFLTLFGVWLSLRAAHARMKAELQAAEARSFRDRERSSRESAADRAHNSVEAARDREHSSAETHKKRLLEEKAKVYARVIDDFAATTAMLGSLPDRPLVSGSDHQKPLLDLGASINKAWLLSEPETALRVRELHGRLNEIFLDCLLRASAIQQARACIKSSTDASDEASRELLRVTRERADLGAKTWSREGAELNGLRAHYEEELERANRELSLAHDSNVALTTAYGMDLLKATGELGELIQAVVLAGRRELGLSSESAALEQQTIDLQRRMEEAYARVTQAMGDNTAKKNA